jgi:hypothetical protein
MRPWTGRLASMLAVLALAGASGVAAAAAAGANAGGGGGGAAHHRVALALSWPPPASPIQAADEVRGCA